MATRLTSNQKIVGSTPTVSALTNFRDSLMVRMGACRVPDRGSIPRRGEFFATTIKPPHRYQRAGCLYYRITFG